MGSYFDDLAEDMLEYFEDFTDHLLKKGRKGHKKTKKRLDKRSRPAYALAERIRGAIYVTVGLSVVYTALVGAVSGMTGVRDIVSFLINNWIGRCGITIIGFAYVVHGAWKVVMGAD
ncbi:MAG: hypothetical protein GF416_06745 [Candidatus Altiarchaeales archaeon]|nr:hypothetical protein [Candidatus Altiarchaeales archaeon]MBD3416811.1 hypothetical protein [Candidatus Altiarchaeales archaeon]